MHVTQNPWLVRSVIKRNPKLKLICLPFAGGSSVAYREWGRLLPESVETIALEIPGRGQRLMEPLVTHLPDLVKQIAENIQGELDRPYAFFGHSMGATLAYELSHHLAARYNNEPAFLFLSGRSAPHLNDREEPIHQLSDEDFWEKIRSFEGTPPEILQHKELMELLLPIIRADFKMVETYVHQSRPPLNIPMTILGGLEDESTPREHLDAWQGYTTASFSVRMFPGGHFFLQKYTAQILELIMRDLSAVMAL